MNTDLAEKIIKRCDEDRLSSDHELRIKAEKFNVAAKGFLSDPQTCDVKHFLGCWARARKAWCDYTGKPLIS